MADDNKLVLPEPEEEEINTTWLVTSADMSLLLLCFFILLYSMSTLDTSKLSDTFSSVTKALKGKMDKVATSRVTREEAGVLIDQALMRRQIVESQRKVFAEVKTRGPGSLAAPADALNAAKQARLFKAAAQYLSKHKAWERPCRFDLVSVRILESGEEIEHVRDAFSPPLGGGHAAWQPW